jgi:hypothetical protein
MHQTFRLRVVMQARHSMLVRTFKSAFGKHELK